MNSSLFTLTGMAAVSVSTLIYTSTLEPFAYSLTDLVFALAVCGRQLARQIELLAVERAYLHRDFPLSFHGFRLAVAGHRFYHRKAF